MELHCGQPREEKHCLDFPLTIMRTFGDFFFTVPYERFTISHSSDVTTFGASSAGGRRKTITPMPSERAAAILP